MCAGTFANENGVYVGPDEQPVDRAGKPIGPPGTIVNEEGYIEAPNGDRYTPQGTAYPRNVPAGITLGPDGVPRKAGTNEPVGPRGTTMDPTGVIKGPDGALLHTLAHSYVLQASITR
jgi:hypothetical protein